MVISERTSGPTTSQIAMLSALCGGKWIRPNFIPNNTSLCRSSVIPQHCRHFSLLQLWSYIISMAAMPMSLPQTTAAAMRH